MYKNGTISLEEARRLFLDDRHANNRSVHTLALYGRALSQFIDWLNKQGHGLNDLKPLVVKQYISYLRDEGTYNATSRQVIAKVIRAWIRYLSDPDEHESPIIRRFKISVPSARSPKKYTPPPEAVDKLIAAANSPRTQVILALLIDTGLRRKELCGLRWADVDFEQGRIFVREAKTNSDEVYIGDHALSLLKQYRENEAAELGSERPEDPVIAKFSDRPPANLEVEDFIASDEMTRKIFGDSFIEPREAEEYESMAAAAKKKWEDRVIEPLLPTNVTRILSKLSKRAGLEHPISPHGLRRFYCTQLDEKGESIYRIMRLMRHRSLTQTERYLADLPDRKLSKAARRSSPYSARVNGDDLAD